MVTQLHLICCDSCNSYQPEVMQHPKSLSSPQMSLSMTESYQLWMLHIKLMLTSKAFTHSASMFWGPLAGIGNKNVIDLPKGIRKGSVYSATNIHWINWSLSVCTCMCMHACVSACTCVCVWGDRGRHVCMHKSMYVHAGMCVCVCVCVFLEIAQWCYKFYWFLHA